MSKAIIINNNLFASRNIFSYIFRALQIHKRTKWRVQWESMKKVKKIFYERLELIMSWCVSFIITCSAIFLHRVALFANHTQLIQPFLTSQLDLQQNRAQERSNNALIISHLLSCFIVNFQLHRLGSHFHTTNGNLSKGRDFFKKLKIFLYF